MENADYTVKLKLSGASNETIVITLRVVSEQKGELAEASKQLSVDADSEPQKKG
jgi:hypothetical protein